MRFEGWAAARDYALIESKKTDATMYVIKRDTGGVHYLVVDNESKISEFDRVMDKFKKGQTV